MIFGRGVVTCDDFGDCHDEVTVAGVDLSICDQFVAIICKGRSVLLGIPNEDSYFGSSILSSMVAQRKSRIRGNESDPTYCI